MNTKGAYVCQPSAISPFFVTIDCSTPVREGETLTEEEVIKFCKANLAAYKVPKMVQFRQELPKTMVGKVLRRLLREEEEKKLAEQ